MKGKYARDRVVWQQWYECARCGLVTPQYMLQGNGICIRYSCLDNPITSLVFAPGMYNGQGPIPGFPTPSPFAVVDETLTDGFEVIT